MHILPISTHNNQTFKFKGISKSKTTSFYKNSKNSAATTNLRTNPWLNSYEISTIRHPKTPHEVNVFVDQKMQEIEKVLEDIETLQKRMNNAIDRDKEITIDGTIMKKVSHSLDGKTTIEELSPKGEVISVSHFDKDTLVFYQEKFANNQKDRLTVMFSQEMPVIYTENSCGGKLAKGIMLKDGFPRLYQENTELSIDYPVKFSKSIHFKDGKPESVVFDLSFIKSGQKISKMYKMTNGKWVESELV